MAGDIDGLKSLALFSHLSDQKLSELTRFLKALSFADGDVIFEEGSQGDSLFFVAEGQVVIQKKAAEGQKELALLSPGDFFGEMALIEETVRSARAVAKGPAKTLVLARKDLFDWLKSEPVMALGFFVELLRVFSQRLRNTSSELTLLFDISHLVLEEFNDGKTFLARLLERVVPHLEGTWTGAAYLANPFTDEVDRVSTMGEGFPADIPKSQLRESGWKDASTFEVVLPGEKGPLGLLVFRSRQPLAPRDKDEASITFTTVAHLVSSTLQNISHRVEDSARARLDQQVRGSINI